MPEQACRELEPERAAQALGLLLGAFEEAWLEVSGDCLRPRVRPGERVRLVGAVRRPPRIGDLVLVRLPGGLRLHRLVWGPPLALPGGAWRTKADRGPFLDPPLRAGDVLATAVEAGGHPTRSLRAALSSVAAGVWARLGR